MISDKKLSQQNIQCVTSDETRLEILKVTTYTKASTSNISKLYSVKVFFHSSNFAIFLPLKKVCVRGNRTKINQKRLFYNDRFGSFIK